MRAEAHLAAEGGAGSPGVSPRAVLSAVWRTKVGELTRKLPGHQEQSPVCVMSSSQPCLQQQLAHFPLSPRRREAARRP